MLPVLVGLVVFLFAGTLDLSLRMMKLKEQMRNKEWRVLELEDELKRFKAVKPLTDAERNRIIALGGQGMLSSKCPNGHFWLSTHSDVVLPLRRCSVCRAIKPWADPVLS
jgi:hypothetical protein